MKGEFLETQEKIVLERRGAVAIVTLNRPEAMNSLNGAMCSRLKEMIEELEKDGEIRVVIVTGAGERAFCTGIDLKERQGMSDADVRALREDVIFPLYGRLGGMRKPLIGAINGLALGGGAEIALICDMRIASEKAGFGQTEVKWGITPGAGACRRLPAIVGAGRAKEILLTGRIVGAAEGLDMGLYNNVTSPADLLARAVETAQMIAENGPVAVAEIKRAVNAEVENRSALVYDRQASEICYHTEDRLEGVAAFNEKRKPRYQGK